MNYDAGPKVKAYDEQLADIAGKIKNMKPESTEECSDLVQLQREYGDVGVEKITFIVKSITGQDGTVEK